jgi:hypothetical protein
MNSWLEIITSDYIQTYVKAGASAVKFVVAAESETRMSLRQSLRRVAETNGFQAFDLDGSLTKLHFIHFLFQEIARQIDWDALADDYLKLCLTGLNLSVIPTTFPADLDQLAEANGTSRDSLANRLSSSLRADLVEDYAMSHEFRMAMLHLCLGRIDRKGAPVSAHRPTIVRWLRGDVQQISTLKDAKVFEKVGRNNARHILVSVAHLLRKIGRNGTLICLDISRYLASNRFETRTAGYYYTPASVVDLYEMLRQFVDDQGSMEGVFIVVFATPQLLSDSYRGVNRYQALKMRILDDVRVQSRQNLLAPLVSL